MIRWHERDGKCFRVAGSMPFSLIGVLASLVQPLPATPTSSRDLHQHRDTWLLPAQRES